MNIKRIVLDYQKKDDLIYFSYNGMNFIIAFEKIKGSELCIYPQGWRVEKKFVFPSFIHHEENKIVEYNSDKFIKFLRLRIKIL